MGIVHLHFTNGKTENRTIKKPAQDHIIGKWHRWDSNPDLPAYVIFYFLPYVFLCVCFGHSHCRIVFHCMNIPWFTYPLWCSWALGLFSKWGITNFWDECSLCIFFFVSTWTCCIECILRNRIAGFIGYADIQFWVNF